MDIKIAQPPKPKNNFGGGGGFGGGYGGGAPAGEPTKIFVGGLSEEITKDQLQEYFSQFGAIKWADIKMDRETGASRGFGFVNFVEASGADAALGGGPHNIAGQEIDCKRAKTRPPPMQQGFGMGG